MIAQDFEYATPTTLDEALSLLAGGDAKPLAGGMSLIPMMKLRLAAPEKLVDLGRLTSLSYIRDDDGLIHIGATSTHYQIESSELLRKRCPLLSQTASAIGDVQVRNMGTLGGSVAHADPAADYPGALQALEAKVKLASSSGERTLTIDEFLVDTFTTALEPGEIITEIIVPGEQPGTGVNYQKCAHPASGFAVVGIGVRVRLSGGKVTLARIGVTGLGARAFRALEAEAALEGTAGGAADLQKASALVAEGVQANADLYASAEYRTHLARIYTMRALTAAVSRIA